MEKSDFEKWMDDPDMPRADESIQRIFDEHAIKERKKEERRKRRSRGKKLDMSPLFAGLEDKARERREIDMSGRANYRERDLEFWSAYEDNIPGVMALYHGARFFDSLDSSKAGFDKRLSTRILRVLSSRGRRNVIMAEGILRMPAVLNLHDFMGLRRNLGTRPRRWLELLDLNELVGYLIRVGSYFHQTPWMNKLDRTNLEGSFSELMDLTPYEKKQFIQSHSSDALRRFEFRPLRINYDNTGYFSVRGESFKTQKLHPGRFYMDPVRLFLKQRGFVDK